ncbi:dual specificity protein phosphatase family protein [Manganibacter manganicus]|nr:dual specificity protein phosphatase family protein [Pseudaminobacter manganicus]
MKSIKRTGIWLGLSVCAGLGAYLGGLQVFGNFHAVVPGQLYRSAQPSAADIQTYAQSYGIRTIVNLRGAAKGADWYEAEVQESKALGIVHIDYPMSASRELTQKRAAELVSILALAAKPILIHCKAGADRSGLASALYVAAVGKRGETASENQISLRYGHISVPLSPTYAMDRTFEALEPWLGFHGS